MNLELISKWYTLLPVSFSVGPVFSILGIDKFVQEMIVNSGGGRKLAAKNLFTQKISQIVLGTPYWVAFSALFLQPFWSGSFPVKFAALMASAALLKYAFGREYIWEGDLDSSSRLWRPAWTRSLGNLWDEIGKVFDNYAYPSAHTITMLGAVLFGVSNPASWILSALVIGWLVATSEHWLSDVIAGAALVFAAKDLLG